MLDKVTIISGCERREVNQYSKNYEPMAKRLVYSIRDRGGKYKDVPIVMWHAEEAAPSIETQSWLTDHGCSVRAGQSLGHNCEPVGNKIIAANTFVSTEYSLWLDSDMYVLDTVLFEELLARTVDIAAVGPEFGFQGWAGPEDVHIWNQFYRLVGVEPPTEKFVGSRGNDECNFYFNSALVLFKNGRGFPEAWLDIAIKIRNSGIPNCALNFTQTSLTIAAVKTAETWEQLPGTYNAYWSTRQEQALQCAILHYQTNAKHIDEHIDDPRIKWDV